MDNLIIGSHVSFSKAEQLLGSVKEAVSYNANTFMFYTGAPQNTTRMPIEDEKTLAGMQLMKEKGIDLRNVIVHAPYIVNPANTDKMAFAISFIRQEIERAEQLGITKLVLHPGSHVNLGSEAGISNIISVLNSTILSHTKLTICLETMAGKGSEVGISIDEMKQIIDNITYNEKIGVCLDTCHLHDSGVNLSEFDSYLDEFDQKIGIDKIKCIHVNDSKNIRGAKKDRHENIGLGEIGFDNLMNIIYHPKFVNIPKILETPYISKTDEDSKKVYPPYKVEIEMIKAKSFNPNLIEDIRNYYK